MAWDYYDGNQDQVLLEMFIMSILSTCISRKKPEVNSLFIKAVEMLGSVLH